MPLFTILYVQNPTTSAAFYQRLLGSAPVESAPTFAMFRLADSHMLGLWVESGVLPATAGSGARMEIAFAVSDHAALESTQARWIEAGAKPLHGIEEMDFGTNVTMLDPDGHRLRVFVPR